MLSFLYRMLSLKNKKQNRVVFALTLFLFSAGVFFLTSQGVNAEESFVSQVGSAVGGAVGGAFTAALNWMLYGVFVLLGWITSMAVTLFEWAINPDYISGRGGLLNKKSIYENWKFIRDFFNLFFILTLLYTAFTIVFQVAKDYKQTLLSLVLAAMFINFSFPITRVIIDVSNVPMYYFVNQMMAKEEGKSIFGNFLGASKIQDALIPKNFNPTTGNTTQLLVAIVMLFLFTISILVLSVMMVIRLVALVILLIFSSVGFAAAIIPGLQKYSSMWWENLFKYALFGPASMLMLLIATRFFEEIGSDATKAGFTQAAMRNTIPQTTDLIASMAQFSIPIIMMWFAIGLSGSMALFGGTAVVGQGQKFAKWAGRKTYNNPIGRGLGAGLKKAGMDGKVLGFDYGKRAKMLTGNYWTAPSKTEAGLKGLVVNRKTGMRSELQKLKDKQIHEQMAKDKENKLSRTDAIGRLNSTDDVMRISAATSLANMDNGIQSMDDLAKALDALKDPVTGTMNPAYAEKAVEIIAKADKKIIADTPPVAATATTPAIPRRTGLENLNVVIGSLGKNEKAINDLISKLDDSAFSGSGVDYGAAHAALEAVKPGMGAALEAKAKKEGQAAVLIDYEIGRAQANGPITPLQEANIVSGILDNMKAGEVADQVSLFTNSPHSQTAIFAVQALQNQPNGGMQRYLEIKKQAKGNVSAIL